MYFTHHKVDTTKVLNGLTCILSEELLVNPNDLMIRSGIGRATMDKWEKDKRTSAKPNELHNEEAMGSILEGTCLMELDLDQDPQADLKNKMRIFDEANI